MQFPGTRLEPGTSRTMLGRVYWESDVGRLAVRRRAEGSCRVFSLAVEAPDVLAAWAQRIATREPGDRVPYEEE